MRANEWLLAEGLPISRGEAALAAGLLEVPEAEFVRCSRDKVNAMKDRELRRVRLLHAVAAVVIVVLGVITWYATSKGYEVRGLLAESDYERAERLFSEDDAPSALWYLSRAVATGAAPGEAAERLVFAITQRSWPVPVFAPVQMKGDVLAISFDPFGSRFVTATRDGLVALWSTADGIQIGTPLSHPRAVRGALFSPDGKSLLTACDDALVRVWDVSKDTVALAGTCAHEDVVAGVAWSQDGKSFATASWDKHVRVWDRANLARARFTAEMKDKAHTVAFSPVDSNHVLGVAKDEIKIWKSGDGAGIFHLQAGADLNGAVFSSDGSSVLSFGNDQEVGLSNLNNDVSKNATVLLPNACGHATFSPDGSMFALASGTRVMAYETSAPRQPAWECTFPARVAVLKFTSDSMRLLIGCDDGRIEIHSPQSGRRVSEPIFDIGAPVALDYHPARQLVLCARANRTVGLWSLSMPRPIPVAAGELSAAPLVLDARSAVRCIGENGKVSTFEIPCRNGKATDEPRITDFGTALTSAVMMADGDGIIGGTPEGRVLIRKAGDAKPPTELGKFKTAVTHFSVAASGDMVAAGSEDGGIEMWHWPSRISAPGVLRHNDKISGLVLMGVPPRLVSAGWNRNIHTILFNDSAGEMQTQVVNSDPVVAGVSPTGREAVFALGNGELWFVGGESATCTLMPMTVGGQPVCVAVGADARRVAVGIVSGHVVVFDLQRKVRVAEMTCGDSRVNSLSFGRNDHWLAVAMEEGFAQVWDANTGHLVSEPLRHHAPVRLVQFSGDDEILVSADRDGLIQAWWLGGATGASNIKALAQRILDTSPATTRRVMLSGDILKSLPAVPFETYLQQLRRMTGEAAKIDLRLLETAR